MRMGEVHKEMSGIGGVGRIGTDVEGRTGLQGGRVEYILVKRGRHRLMR